MSTPVHDAILATLRRHIGDRDPQRDAPPHLLVAVSGGSDSTALLIALADLRGDATTITAAHINHRLRGSESDDDEQFVRELCARLNVPLLVADGVLATENVKRNGIEASAREIRYSALHRLRDASGATFTVTAHHRDDQAETVLLRLLSGRGIASLRGVREWREDGVLRPLLNVGRAELHAFLAQRGIVARDDRSNEDLRYARNRVRHALMPLLHELNPRASEALSAVADDALHVTAIVERELAAVADTWIERDQTSSRLRLAQMPADRWLVRETLRREIRRLDRDARDLSTGDLERLASTLAQCTRTRVTKQLEMLRDGDCVVLRQHHPAFTVTEFAMPLPLDIVVEAGCARVRLRRVDATHLLSREPDRQMFELPGGSDATAFALRNRRPGDRIQPLGFDHTKSVKELMIDRRIAREKRDRIPLLTWCDELLWVPTAALAERFRVGPRTGDLYEATIEWR
jgi:tRNA(Ile)-lysidine synthase